jgi:hypothetical protein
LSLTAPQELQQNMRRKLEVFCRSIPALGLWQTIRAVLVELLVYKPEKDQSFDRRFKTDTTSVVAVSGLEISDPDARREAVLYISLPAQLVRHILRELKLNYEEYEFVDVGCGKGRVMMVAADWPFRAIRGVEICEKLCRTAADNLKRYPTRRRRCFNVEVACEDAREYRLRKHNTVFHFYHPFREEILRSVLGNIASTFRDSGKRAVVIYVGMAVPGWFEVFSGYGFRRLRHVETVTPRYQYAVFEFVGGDRGKSRN